jgi:hypothetical protein
VASRTPRPDGIAQVFPAASAPSTLAEYTVNTLHRIPFPPSERSIVKSNFREAAMRTFAVRRALLPILVAGLAMFCGAIRAVAQEGALTVQVDLAKMVDESQNVVLARVTNVVVEKHPQYENLDTVVVTLQVIEPLKGTPGTTLTFRQYVWDISDRDSKLGYRIGEEWVLMLRQPSPIGLTSPVGLEQGRFRVERDALNNRIVRNGTDNAGLFGTVDQTSPGLRPRLSPQLQQLVSEHHSGPISYDQLKSLVQNEVAARQAAQ